tara:strand:+ start:421 stop:1203 length:783 start_codon:yes stop_codon:yes gene_type:complete
MSHDITRILGEWEYDPNSNVREIWGDDGVCKIQVRIDQGAFQGILQLNLDGRPDGEKPHGFDFVLDYYCHLCEQREGEGEEFVLDSKACSELFDESARIYGRYAFLLELRDYERVIRDTERNISLFRFVNTYAEREEDRTNLEKWWPYILRIRATARAMLASQEGAHDQAVEIVRQACDEIDQMPEVEAEEFFIERERSQQVLETLEEELQENRPLSQEEQLQRDLDAAIERENFEKAAELRDALKKLRDDELEGSKEQP